MRVATQLHGFAATREEADSHTAFRLEPAPGADYAFSVLITDGGDPALMAQLVTDPAPHPFWRKPFEASNPSSFDDRDGVFLEMLERCLDAPTRITQRKGLLFCHFWCWYREEEEWKSLGGATFGRWEANMPPIKGRLREYHSPRLPRAA